MPYIKQADRDNMINTPRLPENPGELNYGFTVIAREYLKYKGTSYQTINDIIGALEGAKMEFYRRIAIPYEDTKIKENGDVY